MQETQSIQRKKPLFVIGLAAAAVVVLLAALFIAQSIFYKSYSAQFDKLKAMVADASARFDRGDTADGASPADQVRFYRNLDAEAVYLSGILKQLNDSYPLLLARASEKSAGIEELKLKSGQLSPGLATFKECIDEDGAIAGSLSSLLSQDSQGGQTAGYLALQSRSGALEVKISGLAFAGALEGSRKSLADGAARRGVAIDFLCEESAAGEALAAVLSDTQSSPDDLIAKSGSLLQQYDALQAKAAGADMTSYGEGGAAVGQMLAARRGQISSMISYLTELKAVQQGVQQFNGKLEQGLAGGGKFSAKLASWMVWMKDFNTLQGQLDALHTKYADLGYKRALESLGLNETGQTLSGYANALNAVDGAVQSSAAVEKEIDSVMKNAKLTLVQKTMRFETLLQTNAGILAKIGVEVPSDLAMGLSGFKAGCEERAVFLDEYMGYVADKTYADGHAKAQSYYNKQYSYYKAEAVSHPSDKALYDKLAGDQSLFASQEKAAYSASLKDANVHKKAYEASRAKYVPMLDQ